MSNPYALLHPLKGFNKKTFCISILCEYEMQNAPLLLCLILYQQNTDIIYIGSGRTGDNQTAGHP